MTVVSYRKVNNRLGATLAKPGGKPHAVALASADEMLAELSDVIEVELDAKIAALAQAIVKARAKDKDAQAEVYDAANAVASLGGSCGHPEITRAAFSLCSIVDRFLEAGMWQPEAIAVHMNAILLLRRRDALDDAGREAVLAGLDSLVSWAPQ